MQQMRVNKKISKAFAKLDKGTRQKLLKELGISSEEEITLKQLHNLLRSDQIDLNLKISIYSIVIENGSKKSISVLLDAFVSEDEDISHQAMLGLSTITSEEALTTILDVLHNPRYTAKRCQAAYALQGYFSNEEAIQALAGVLNNKDEAVQVRSQAAESLGRIADNNTTNVLVENLNDPSKEIQFWCIYALCQICMDASIIPKLEKFIEDETVIDNTWTIGSEAKEAISFIKAREIILSKYKDKSKVDIWDIHTEVLDEIERTRICDHPVK